MYAVSLGFIIFVSVAYSLQIQTFSFHQQQTKGTYLQLSTDDVYSKVSTTGKPGSLNSDPSILSRLERIIQHHPNIVGHGWITHRLTTALVNVTNIEVSHVGNLFPYTNTPYGISPSFFEASLQQFLISSSQQDTRGLDPVELSKYLYSKAGTGALLLSSLYKQLLGLNQDSTLLYNAEFFTKPTSASSPTTSYKKSFRLKVAAFLDSAPAFIISPFPAQFRQDSVISFPTFFHFLTQASDLGESNYESMEEIPLDKLLLKLDKDSSADNVITDIRTEISNSGITIWDYRNEMVPFNTATTAMTYFFNLTTAIAMSISFFSLMSSMFTNIYEQTKEIGVLRALGVTKFGMYRIYIYEAFVLVMSSSLLGIFIGSFVSYTMTLQQILFTQLPIPFQFPWTILVTVFVCSILFAIMAAFSPIYRVLQKRIVQIFRMVS